MPQLLQEQAARELRREGRMNREEWLTLAMLSLYVLGGWTLSVLVMMALGGKLMDAPALSAMLIIIVVLCSVTFMRARQKLMGKG